MEWLREVNPPRTLCDDALSDPEITVALFSQMVVKIGKAISDKKAQNSAMIISCHMTPGRTAVEASSMCKLSFSLQDRRTSRDLRRERMESF